MAETVRIPVSGGEMAAYVARPAASRAPAIVVLQEIFGVNAVMRDITDGLAAQGFLAICPDLFWRIEPGVDITDRTEAEWKKAFALMNAFDASQGVKDIAATLDHIRADPGCNGKAGAVGFCLGGQLAWLTAARTDADAAVSYYGVGIEGLIGESRTLRKPVMLHIAEADGFVPPAAQAAIREGLADQPLATIHTYSGRDHAFARLGGEHYHAADAALAGQRTLDFLRLNLGAA
ncbi:MAG: dienelactone hydrolase family protein [Phenylobacterium sp.]|uniref:dienelactone hydrolase family protein n=1 Tax=Phenylobacterium sp. TaxID=1871053 RepID=UPI0025E20E42|nr:dienelactone hydrolase family protein [Phenylobacterium sp.]MCA4915203.1 dienelactone hydrolase family protein [Phenylobacterium sp.]MCA6282244.1 dienelactone hydrolase family protein [Phenylobacterium sp.]